MLKFIDKAHEEFVKNKYNEFKKFGMTDVYYSSLIYTLGICETTREHFDEIYERGEGINIDCLHSAWQTGTSEKVVRMAFSLWNRCMYDSEEDRKNGIISSYYNPSEIFCCSYAPYFYEAIKIRYPEYTRENTRNTEQLLNLIENENKHNTFGKAVGLYIRTASSGKDAEEEIFNQIEQLRRYCAVNNIFNTKKYLDIGRNGLDLNREALKELLDDVKEKRIDKIVVTDISRIHRNPNKAIELLNKDFMESVEIITLDHSLEKFEDLQYELLNNIKEQSIITEEETRNNNEIESEDNEEEEV